MKCKGWVDWNDFLCIKKKSRTLPQQLLVLLLEDLPKKQGPSLEPSQSHQQFPSSLIFDPTNNKRDLPEISRVQDNQLSNVRERPFTSFTANFDQSESSWLREKDREIINPCILDRLILLSLRNYIIFMACRSRNTELPLIIHLSSLSFAFQVVLLWGHTADIWKHMGAGLYLSPLQGIALFATLHSLL